jgi:uncharacterized protein
MNKITCACLVAQQDHALLLVRVRDNQHWYLPGGKLEPGELPEQALERELHEELGIVIDPQSVRYLYTVSGPAYGQAGEVELICFAADWQNVPRPHGEISEVEWIDWREHERLAPAVQILCARWFAHTVQPVGLAGQGTRGFFMSESLLAWQPRLIALATAGSDDDGAHDVSHLNRVWKAACALLADYPEADALIVQAACYLHDIVNLPKNHPERRFASRHAAKLACERLTQAGFPSAKLEGLAHAIEAHSFSAGIVPVTLEAKIVQDADRLDALGAVGLARLYYTAGRMGSALAHPTDPLALHREMDDRAFALDHIESKLATLPASMQTDAGRKLGQAWLAWLRDFRDTFVAEWGTADSGDV